ncbi:hypothetical protein HYQ46_012554 [Verticillium longisporum]|nr:hypothetical protein HYQ46_012554 [Verticillium longisporum]
MGGGGCQARGSCEMLPEHLFCRLSKDKAAIQPGPQPHERCRSVRTRDEMRTGCLASQIVLLLTSSRLATIDAPRSASERHGI